MKKKSRGFMRKTVCLFIVLVVLLSSVNTTYATPNTKIIVATKLADELKELGLFLGTDTGYQLERAGTRTEAIIMLLRLLNEERIAKDFDKQTFVNDTSQTRLEYFIREGIYSFTDVPSWATNYIAYAFINGYTSGVSKTKFGANDKVTSAQFITLILRALGYSEMDGYTWNNPYAFAEKIGLVAHGEYSNNSEFLRADMVILSHRALDIKYGYKDWTLRERLFGKITETSQEPIEPGTGDKRDAGVFNTPDDSLLVVDWNATVEANRRALNGMLGRTYGISYIPGLTTDGYTTNVARLVTDWANNREGVEISSWRKFHDTNVAVNSKLNAVLETFYFYTGDKDVAVSLWKWFDDVNINGKSNTTNFGFTTVTSTSTSATIKKNGIEIDIVVSGKTTTVYFK